MFLRSYLVCFKLGYQLGTTYGTYVKADSWKIKSTSIVPVPYGTVPYGNGAVLTLQPSSIFYWDGIFYRNLFFVFSNLRTATYLLYCETSVNLKKILHYTLIRTYIKYQRDLDTMFKCRWARS